MYLQCTYGIFSAITHNSCACPVSYYYTYIHVSSSRVVVHSKVNKSDYSTLSLHGVTRMIAGREPQFTDLEQWVADLTHFNQLVKIATFSKFRMWKAFATWRKNVRSRY